MGRLSIFSRSEAIRLGMIRFPLKHREPTPPSSSPIHIVGLPHTDRGDGEHYFVFVAGVSERIEHAQGNDSALNEAPEHGREAKT